MDVLHVMEKKIAALEKGLFNMVEGKILSFDRNHFIRWNQLKKRDTIGNIRLKR